MVRRARGTLQTGEKIVTDSALSEMLENTEKMLSARINGAQSAANRRIDGLKRQREEDSKARAALELRIAQLEQAWWERFRQWVVALFTRTPRADEGGVPAASTEQAA